MKKLTVYWVFIMLLFVAGCHQENCDGVNTYPKLDPRLLNYVFKTGSYWVYRDTVDGITDSQYVYSYTYLQHYRNPCDTPNHCYPQIVSPGGSTSDLYCGPYYLDKIEMDFASIRNSVVTDSLSLYGPYGGGLSMGVHLKSSQGAVFYNWFLLNPHDTAYIGQMAYQFGSSASDTIKFGYEGKIGALSVSSYTFTNVMIYRVQIIDPRYTKFNNPTDLYFVSGAGIVKMVEHRASGDVPWDLISYHIVN